MILGCWRSVWCSSLGLIGVSLLMIGCASNPVTGKTDFVMMSEDQEIALGRQYHQSVLKEFDVYENPELQSYVSRIGEALARDSHRKDLVFHFTLLDSPTVNAFALPGGYVYITRGIMSYMNSEAHLAGVLGHEIGHVTARHSVRQHSQATLAGILGSVITAQTGSQSVGDLSNLLGTAWIRGYGRKHELEADRLGAEYLALTGYDPEDMIGVIGILKSQEEFEAARAQEEGREARSYHGVFATHPDNDDRLKEVVRAADRFRTTDVTPPDREAFLKRLDGMTFGPGEAQGVFRGTQFYHKAMDFTLRFPDGWQVENRPDRLVAVSSDNNAAIQLGSQDLNRRESPREFLEDQFSDLQDGQVIDGSLPGYTGIARLNTPFGQRPSRVAAVFHEKRVFILLGAQRDGVLQKPFIDTVKSLRRLRDDEIALAAERRIQLARAKPGDTFAKLAEQTTLSNHAEDQLRLLNGMYPDGEPEPGQLIKLVK